MDFLSLLQSSQNLLLTVMAFIGLIVGSFLNVVITRLPRMLEREWRCECSQLLSLPTSQPDDATPFNLATPASSCPNCNHRIRAWENIPVISFLLLRGRCSQCKKTISAIYPAVETASMLLSIFTALTFGATTEMLFLCLLGWSLLTLAVIDLKTKLLPDNITLPLLWLGLLFNIATSHIPLEDAVIGAIVGYLSLWSVYQIFKLITGKEGMGFGDFKLLAALGAWLGWQALPVIILLSSTVGTLITLTMIALGRQQSTQPVPFGPFLAIAGFTVLFFGEKLSELWWTVIQA